MKKATKKTMMKKTTILPCNCESRQPFQHHVAFDFAGGGSATSAPVVTVPAGKRLMVKYASFLSKCPSGAGEKILSGRLLNAAVVHELVVTFVGTNSLGHDMFVGSGPVLICVESGETLKAGILKATSSANALSQDFTVSGYYVDV